MRQIVLKTLILKEMCIIFFLQAKQIKRCKDKHVLIIHFRLIVSHSRK